MRPPPLAPALLEALCAHLEQCYPEEGCGVVLVGAGGARVLPLRNASAGDPRHGFAFEPREWLQLSKGADAAGERVRCVFHSHVDGAAYLSAADREAAAPGGQALLPGVLHLVVSVRCGSADEAAAFRAKDGEFLEEWRGPAR